MFKLMGKKKLQFYAHNISLSGSMATLFLEQRNHWIDLAIDNVKLGLYDIYSEEKV